MKINHHYKLSYSIKDVLRSGSRLFGSVFMVYVQKSSMEKTRFAVIAGVRVDKRAVMRNRAKRVLRQAVSNLIPQFRQNIDLVIVAKSANWRLLSVTDIQNELSNMLHNNGVL